MFHTFTRILGILPALIVVANVSFANEASVAAPPTFKPGFSVIWNSTTIGIFRLTFIRYEEEADCPLAPCSKWIAYSSRGTAYIWKDQNLNEYKRATVDGQPIIRPYVKYLRFPLVVGDSWDNDFLTRNATRIKQTVKVVGWEKIKIAAGEFNAVHLHTDNSWLAVPYTGVYVEDYYYVPAMGVVAKFDSQYFQDEAKQTEIVPTVPK